MSKSIALYPKKTQEQVVLRRLKLGLSNGVGLGTLAAMDWTRHVPAASLSHETRATCIDLLKDRSKRSAKGIKL